MRFWKVFFLGGFKSGVNFFYCFVGLCGLEEKGGVVRVIVRGDRGGGGMVIFLWWSVG